MMILRRLAFPSLLGSAVVLGAAVVLSGCFGLEDAQKKKVREQKIARLAESGCSAYLAETKGRVRFRPWSPPPSRKPTAKAMRELRASTGRGRMVHMRVLLLGTSRRDQSFKTAEQLLTDYGVPHTSMVARRGTLPHLERGGVGRYQTIFFSSSEVLHGLRSDRRSKRHQGSEPSGKPRPALLTRSEKRRIRVYERRFGVREATLSLAGDIPGLKVIRTREVSDRARPNPEDAGPAMRLTALGRRLLRVLPAGYESPLGTELTQFVRTRKPARSLLVTPHGTVGALTAGNRLVLTYEQGVEQLTTLSVFPAVVSWATRGIFIGERYPILVMQIDDMFLPNFKFGGGTYRMKPKDWRANVAWTKRQRRKPLTRDFTLDWVFNATQAVRCDKLTRAMLADRDLFNWTDHTYEHLNLDSESTGETYEQVVLNNRAARALRLPRYDPRVAVTGEHSGLHNRDAMLGMRKAGVNILASNTDEPGQAPAHMNELIPNFVVPEIMMVPRHPTNLFVNVGTRREWLSTYNDRYRGYWRRDVPYEEMLASESKEMMLFTLRGDWGPFFLHQINMRAFNGRNFPLSDLLDRFFEDYRKRAKEPLRTPTFQGVARMMQGRAEFRLCHPEGILRLSRSGRPTRVRLVAGRRCRIPVTGIGRKVQVGVRSREFEVGS